MLLLRIGSKGTESTAVFLDAVHTTQVAATTDADCASANKLLATGTSFRRMATHCPNNPPQRQLAAHEMISTYAADKTFKAENDTGFCLKIRICLKARTTRNRESRITHHSDTPREKYAVREPPHSDTGYQQACYQTTIYLHGLLPLWHNTLYQLTVATAAIASPLPAAGRPRPLSRVVIPPYVDNWADGRPTPEHVCTPIWWKAVSGRWVRLSPDKLKALEASLINIEAYDH